jgi:hypothetical protein
MLALWTPYLLYVVALPTYWTFEYLFLFHQGLGGASVMDNIR